MKNVKSLVTATAVALQVYTTSNIASAQECENVVSITTDYNKITRYDSPLLGTVLRMDYFKGTSAGHVDIYCQTGTVTAVSFNETCFPKREVKNAAETEAVELCERFGK